MVHIVLVLSASAPFKWAEYFNNQWKQHLYMMKRNAAVSGKELEIYCVPDELQQYHFPELKKVIAETNLAYRAHLEQTKRSADAELRERTELANLKSKLKFD